MKTSRQIFDYLTKTDSQNYILHKFMNYEDFVEMEKMQGRTSNFSEEDWKNIYSLPTNEKVMEEMLFVLEEEFEEMEYIYYRTDIKSSVFEKFSRHFSDLLWLLNEDEKFAKSEEFVKSHRGIPVVREICKVVKIEFPLTDEAVKRMS